MKALASLMVGLRSWAALAALSVGNCATGVLPAQETDKAAAPSATGAAATRFVAAKAETKKIVFLAGRASHGYGAHEHYAGCMLLAKCLQEAMPTYEIHVVQNGWPSDATILENAHCIVMYADGGGGHPVMPHLAEMDAMTSQGVGLVCLHYAVEIPKGPPGDQLLKWIGGYFETHWSVNPHWTAKFDKFPDHPICRGVGPFESDDEWYYHMRFREGMQGVTPILTAIPPESTLSRPDGPHSGNPAVRAEVGKPQHVAWAAERADGGRGFGFTGGHHHWNWGDPEFRKLVLNAIVWAAKDEVPAEGVSERPLSLPDLEVNQDEPPSNVDREAIRKKFKLKPDDGAGAAATPKANGRRAAVAPVFRSDIITAQTPGHGVQVVADIGNAKRLFLVVQDAGNGFGCDWADWAEPRLIGPAGELKLTEMKWTSATCQWGEVRVNQNAGGGPLRIAGNPIPHGIGTHANSLITFDLPAGYEKFVAFAGLDNGGTDQGGGNSSVQFLVYTRDPGPIATSGADAASRDPADAVSALDVADGLEATLAASEPNLLSLTNLDIDHRGRVWVCEVVNYRRHSGERPEGDRILILEDQDGDGRVEHSKVFYQGRDIDSAMGICVLGKRVVVSASPNVLVFTDEDGDDRPERKEILFSNTGQPQHDHSAHSFLFGPDGKLYWNFGNTGQRVCDPEGKPIVDTDGKEVVDNGKPYFGGMPFRCNPDGSQFEVLAHNFRNNYEVTVDSFGGVWQSDNDDDGNRGVRLNYVMEHGNYGYRDEVTGAGWQSPRTNMEDDIPLRHWHLNDPGVVPNLIQTGAGSPTGITVYEGRLLPRVFWDQVIHCDAGPNVVRCYPVAREQSGYRAESVNLLHGARDNWFRPADVCVAPDGSVFVTDWYDPGVGGHAMGDTERGRLFRVAPPGHRYEVPKLDLATPEGAIEGLKNPNLATRYMAHAALREMGERARPALQSLFAEDPNPRFRARALWLIASLPDLGRSAVHMALNDESPDIRIVGLRIAKQFGIATPSLVSTLVSRNEADRHVLRECAVALWHQKDDAMPAAWAELALRHEVNDRWYLEALGIGADGRWDECLDAYWTKVGRRAPSDTDLDIIWRSRGSQTSTRLTRAIEHGSEGAGPLARYFRAFDFQQGSEKIDCLLGLAFNYQGSESDRSLVVGESLARLTLADLSRQEGAKEGLLRILREWPQNNQFVEFVTRFQVESLYPDLFRLAVANPASELGIESIRSLLSLQQQSLIQAALDDPDPNRVASVLDLLSNAADGRSVGLLVRVMRDEQRDLEPRRKATMGLARTVNGAKKLLEFAERGSLPDALRQAAAGPLHASSSDDIRAAAAKFFPLPVSKDETPLPPLPQILTMAGDPMRGRTLFSTTALCANCHQVADAGKEVGPALNDIGAKLSRQAMFESILFPSAGISHNYETHALELASGNIVTGILVSSTDQEVVIKTQDAVTLKFPRSDIASQRALDVSLMPADLQKQLSAQDLVDVVDYLATLRGNR